MDSNLYGKFKKHLLGMKNELNWKTEVFTHGFPPQGEVFIY